MFDCPAFFFPVFEKVNASILLDPSFFKLSRPDPGRNYLKCYSAGYFEEQKGILWHQHKQELDKWHGPFMDDAGRQPLGDKSDVRKHGDFYDWIGLRKKIQETIVFPIKYGALFLPSGYD